MEAKNRFIFVDCLDSLESYVLDMGTLKLHRIRMRWMLQHLGHLSKKLLLIQPWATTASASLSKPQNQQQQRPAIPP
ncbi:hypothetical protein HPB47_011957 [Ixodes persulcatus]|uniref:Uncharacterized protein n=1 Tax=Ixodes persulcatus TaxID=34615 RepID=A0AC60NUW4_IXOPE|nr:hypothetical protein HPB47_011957 [Ixodes persulcatus]